jgi:hypothetical protein
MSLRIWITLLWVGSIAAVVGCSGKTPPAEAPAAVPGAVSAPATGATPVVATPTVTTPAVAPQPAVANTVDPSKPETKWIGTIPYDVFYDQPLLVANDATAVNGGGPEKPATPAGPDVAMDKPTEGGTTPAEVPPAAAGSKLSKSRGPRSTPICRALPSTTPESTPSR